MPDELFETVLREASRRGNTRWDLLQSFVNAMTWDRRIKTREPSLECWVDSTHWVE
jgi:hypothetical protein